MFDIVARRFFGSANERYMKRIQPLVTAINAAEPEVEKLSDADLRGRTDWLRKRYEDGESLDDLRDLKIRIFFPVI